ncbi:UDP-Glycosyltransferase/glycogen phosphorylase [Westerdykella ornata]|uniref:UDP-Glycosyltransferase/glycogen phosphorylase n=1 Tax=Westerdykella ornata TaxID=318751 RepID=A0A6A6JJI4_WESOR|nr:UDP-Glycosyltransferase/glycogen phosphorylase [Westerdykella ornata]KAF2276148.1 UDP-Glycosyltransferase/glycogen phosphorylase [Westerdykella ornata]
MPRVAKSNYPGQLAIDDANMETLNHVRTDGRINVQFHSNPQQLAEYFKRFHSSFGEHRHKKQSQASRKNSIAFLDEKVAISPRLNIAIHIVGSRGDVQPFIPIAQLLQKQPFNHRVRICTHPVFKAFVESNGVEFFSIGGDPEALMAYMVKNPGLLPSMKSIKAGDISKRRKEMTEIMNGVWRSCIESGDGMGTRISAAQVPDAKDLFIADAIIANPPSMAHIHCAEKLGIPLHMVFTMPWSPTQAFHHPLAAMDYGEADKKVANYLSYMAMELLTWQGLGDLINKFRTRTLRLDPISPMWGYQLLPRLRVPYTYLWSESLIPRPQDWDSHINITGFSFLNQATSYTPPVDLSEFLESGPPPVYIGFGSIVVDDPQALTRLVLEAAKLANVRAIVSTGWGGVGGGGEEVPDNIYLIGNCPHDWLFQRVSVVVHHGGAGTTAAGIAAGRPTIVVPFFGDQPFWGDMIARAGAGPVPVPFKKLTAAALAAGITFALKPEVQAAVQKMAQNIAQEHGAENAAADVQSRLDIGSLRCDVCPSRVAHWKHKKTGAHLSSFAASSLVHAGVQKPRDFKLLRHKHWYVNEGAEGPIVGALASVSGFFMAVGTATSEFLYQLKVPPAVRPREESIKSPPPTNNANGERAVSPPSSYLNDPAGEIPPRPLKIQQMQHLAHKMATKSLSAGDATIPEGPSPTFRERHKMMWKARDKGEHGRAYHITRAFTCYAGQLAKISLEAPIAFFYNVANGFHNSPSYVWNGGPVRRRDEITGFGSGLKAAGKEFAMGFYDALSGIVVQPYIGAERDGGRGLAKGVLGAGAGFVTNVGAAVFSLPGYTLKGIEKEFAKRHLTKLTAEIMLVRLRQGIDDLHHSTQAERRQVVTRWGQLQRS